MTVSPFRGVRLQLIFCDFRYVTAASSTRSTKMPAGKAYSNGQLTVYDSILGTHPLRTTLQLGWRRRFAYQLTCRHHSGPCGNWQISRCPAILACTKTSAISHIFLSGSNLPKTIDRLLCPTSQYIVITKLGMVANDTNCPAILV